MLSWQLTTTSDISGLLADLADEDRGASLLGHLLALLLGHLLALLLGNIHAFLLWHLIQD
jgi:hypothetical protein